MANVARTLYVGVTNSIEQRVQQHKSGTGSAFTSRYKLNRLDVTGDVEAAIAREKQIKGWLRSKKLELISEMNPLWRDLSEDWAVGTDSSPAGSE